MKRILVLLHHNDPYPKIQKHFVWHLVNAWRDSGYEVIIQKGIDSRPDADLVIPHINLTVRPEAYDSWLNEYPNVINRNVKDISKSKVSMNLVSIDDTYVGPIIVKTDLNYGGRPERELLASHQKSRAARIIQHISGRAAHLVKTGRRKGAILPEYPVYQNKSLVPLDTFASKDLIVEKFIPEQDSTGYYSRIHVCFGAHHINMRIGSGSPVVKGDKIFSRVRVRTPQELLDIRQRLGLEFAKIDYVVHNGKVSIFDINPTPGSLRDKNVLKENCRVLAPGINDFLSAPYK